MPYFLGALIVSQALIVIFLGVLISKKSFLGKQVLGEKESTWPKLASANASGIDCINTLFLINPSCKFKISMRKRKTGGSFCYLNRTLYLSETQFTRYSPYSILAGAHEFAHTQQANNIWRLLNLLLAIGNTLVLLAIIITILMKISPILLIALEFIFIAMFNASSTPAEINAIQTSYFLATEYISKKELSSKTKNQLENCWKVKTSAEAPWYILSNIHHSFLVALFSSLFFLIQTMHI